MSVHDLPFERLVDLSELATGPSPQRFDLLAGALSPQSNPVQWLLADASQRADDLQYRSSLPAVRVYALPGHVLGRAGAARGDSVFWREDCHSNALREVFADADAMSHDWAGPLADAAAEIVELDQPVASVLSPGIGSGHPLLEVLPRLWLIDQLARMGRPLAVAVDADAPEWLADLVGLFVPPERMVHFDGRHQLLRAPAVVVSSIMQLDGYLHPAFNLAVEAAVDRVVGAGSRPAPSARLFLAGHHGSVVANVDGLEQRLRAAGFEILRPDATPFTELVRAYASARVVVSEYGPHSVAALFAPPGSAHVALNRLDPALERTTAARGQRLGLVELSASGMLDLDAVMRFVGQLEGVPASQAAVPQPPRPAIAVTRESVATGLYVAGMTDIGDRPVLAPSARVKLPAFLHAEPVDPALSPYARLFTDPGPHAYEAQAVVCGRLGGASLLGDSGLALWRGALVADSVDSGDFARAAGFSLAVGVDGRPVAAPFARRSHPGRALFAGYTGRWSDEAGFLAECLPRLVAFARLVAAGTVGTLCVPASAPGSIQARALDLLGFVDVSTVAPDQLATGSRLWLPSRIDPWQASPLVVEAARALAALVPADPRPTPKRLYLRGPAGARPPLAGFERLAAVLARHGFEVVTLANHDLDTRIRLMRGAEAVVGEATGGLGHVAFCQPGARVLELFAPASVQPPHYVLAALAGLGYGFLVGQHVAEPGHEVPSVATSYTIDPDRLAAALADLLRAAPPPQIPVELPGSLLLDPARQQSVPRPFFAAPSLPDLALAGTAARLVPHAGLALDGHGATGPAEADATVVGGHLVATLAPDGTDPLLGALPRLLAARLVREQHPGGAGGGAARGPGAPDCRAARPAGRLPGARPRGRRDRRNPLDGRRGGRGRGHAAARPAAPLRPSHARRRSDHRGRGHEPVAVAAAHLPRRARSGAGPGAVAARVRAGRLAHPFDRRAGAADARREVGGDRAGHGGRVGVGAAQHAGAGGGPTHRPRAVRRLRAELRLRWRRVATRGGGGRAGGLARGRHHDRPGQWRHDVVVVRRGHPNPPGAGGSRPR